MSVPSPSSTFQTINSGSAEQAALLAEPTPDYVSEAFGEHYRRFLFGDIPDRGDAGIDWQWGSWWHRSSVRLRQLTERGRERLNGRRVPKPLYLRTPVDGGLRGLIVGLVLEVVFFSAIVLYVIARKVY